MVNVNAAPMQAPQYNAAQGNNPPPPAYDPLYGQAPAYQGGPKYEPLVLTQEMKTDIVALLDKSMDIANPHLNLKDRAQARQMPARANAAAAAPVNIDLSDRSVRLFNNEQVHHHHHNNNQPVNAQAKKEEDEKANRQLAVIGGVILAAVSAFVMGKYTALFEQANEDIQAIEALVQKWDSIKFTGVVVNYQTIDLVQKTAMAILTRNYNNLVYKTAYVFSLLVTGGLLVAGGIAASEGLMIAGLVLGGSTSIAMIGRASYNYFSNKDAKDAAYINTHVPNLKRAFNS